MSIREFVQMCYWFFIGQHLFARRMHRAMRQGKFLDFIRREHGDSRMTEDVVLMGHCGDQTAASILLHGEDEPPFTPLYYTKVSRVYGISQETNREEVDDIEVEEPTRIHYSKMSRVYNASKGAT